MRIFYFILGFILFSLFLLFSASFIDLNLFSFSAFIFIVASIIYKDRKNIKFTAGILLMRRTKRFRDTIDSIAQRHKTFWGAFGTLGVVVAIVVMILGSLLLIDQTVKIATGALKEGARFILPGPAASLDVPGVLFVPWWIWIIAIAFVIIPHETMHGIMCRIDKVRIKSVGWILLLILPGAFVEPDENQLEKQSRKTKMRVYAAGSFINVFLAGIILLLLILISSAFFVPSGVAFQAPDNSSFGKNVTASIIEISGQRINSIDQLRNELAKHEPGDAIEVKTAELDSGAPIFSPLPSSGLVINDKNAESHTLVLQGASDNRPVLGIAVIGTSYVFLLGSGMLVFYMLLFWLFAISFFVGLVNILPIKPLDGGFLFEEIVKKFTKHHKPIVTTVTIFMVLMIAFSVLGPILL